MHKIRLDLYKKKQNDSCNVRQRWGGEEEILALSHVNGAQITVHSERGGVYSDHTYDAGAGARAGAAIHLRYTRNEERAALTGDPEAGGHYELLLM
eukprot:COSAG06_NODE_15274_length_1084_cov_1.235533_1_plen_96_part_00